MKYKNSTEHINVEFKKNYFVPKIAKIACTFSLLCYTNTVEIT